MLRQIILDTETTGLEPSQGHRIIEIGCLEMVNRRITGEYYHQYINPEREIDAEALKVHGITPEFLADKPVFKNVAAEFMEYVKGADLIIHNAPFDVGFINHEFQLAGIKQNIESICHIIDTLTFARHKHPGQKNSLDALCRRYHVDNSNRDLHGALLDSELLAQVYLLMTGGQTQLFSENQDAQNNVESENTIKRITQRMALPLVTVTAEDEHAHQAWLEKLRKEGACVWDDLQKIKSSHERE